MHYTLLYTIYIKINKATNEGNLVTTNLAGGVKD